MIYLLLPLLLTFADSTQHYYSREDAASLRAVCADAAPLEAALLCRYRLYPLTEARSYVEPLPTELAAPTARTLALLSGLWGYRAARAPLPAAIRYGLRADRLLERARALDPDEPFVLLIDGQSLLFRPAFAGRDAAQALARFDHLRRAIRDDPHCGISMLEADLWRWYALLKLGDDRAEALRHRLLAQDPPPLYRTFLHEAT